MNNEGLPENVMNSPQRKIVFLLSSHGLKSRVVIEHLLNDDWFMGNYEIGVVVDQSEGEVPELLTAADIQYIVAPSPQSPSTTISNMFDENPDYIVSCGWGHYIPSEAIQLASIESLNCHGSYLPDYRGPNAYRAAWANGCETGGASVHILTDEFDDGRIIRRESFRIAPLDTPLEIGYKASELTASLLRESIFLVESGYEGISNRDGSYYPKISWTKTLLHGAVNNLSRLIGFDWRWKIPPR